MEFKYTQLGHIALLCNDVDAMMRFYLNTLQLKYAFTLEKDGMPWLTYLKIPASGQFIELFYRRYPSQNSATERSFQKLCIEVESLSDMLSWLNSLNIPVFRGPVSKGVRMDLDNPELKPAPCGSLCAFILDPEGNEVELQQFTKDSLQLKS